MVSAAARPSAPRPARSTIRLARSTRAELREARNDDVAHVRPGFAQCRRELTESRKPEREVRPAAFGVQTADGRHHTQHEALNDFRVGFQPYEIPETGELIAAHIGRGDALADSDQRVERLLVERKIEGRELRKALGLTPVECDQLAGVGVDARLARGAGARLQALSNQREHGALALGRKVEPRQRAGHDFRRGGLEVEQEAERVRQIEVGEVLQDLAFYPSVEQARQDGPAQEHLPAFWIQLQHRVASRENITRAMRGSRAPNSVATSLNFCASASAGDCVSASSSVRRKSIEASDDRIVDEQREIDKGNRREPGRGVQPDPALVWRVEVIHRSAAREHFFAAGPLIVDERRDGAGRGVNAENFGAVRLPQRDAADAMLGEHLREVQALLATIGAGEQVERKVRQLAGRGCALDRDLCDAGAVEPARELAFDQCAPAHRHFVDGQLVRRNAEVQVIALLELRQRAVPRLDCLLAEGAGGRVRVKLLNGAREELQALFSASTLGASGNRTLRASRACTGRAS